MYRLVQYLAVLDDPSICRAKGRRRADRTGSTAFHLLVALAAPLTCVLG
jgi:hypothetical protein